MQQRPFTGAAGFTLVELVIVLIVAGILAAVGASRYFVLQDFQERGFYDDTLAAVRYAQKLAVASGCDIEVSVSPAGYGLLGRPGCTTGAFSVAVRKPGAGGPFTGAPPSGVTVGTMQFYYDQLGRPIDPASNAVLTTNPSVVIGGRTPRTIIVEHETGFVH
ncbi:MAG TPA: type II secretion system protein [Gammaproteobacteria bacterium]|nr:type II secretion system protein [Gammaproteobacteria bacterium]